MLTCNNIDTAQLSWSSERQEFSACLSDLPMSKRFNDRDRNGRPRCYGGYTLRSHRTGRTVDFVVVGVVRNSDGDITSWMLHPAPWENVPHCTFVIYND